MGTRVERYNDMSVYIIAEAGVNHNGEIENAFKLIDAAIEAKADAVKFQLFNAENIVSKNAKKAEYQKAATDQDETQFEMLKKLELSQDEYIKLHEYCMDKPITLLATAFDFDSIDFLQKLDTPVWKIPSGEVTNLPYLEKIAKVNKPIIISTGMCSMSEVEQAVTIIKKYNDNITVLHCNTEYPTPYRDVNLRAMQTMKDAFSIEIGYSDHTESIEIPIAAVAMGASIIEKHFTLDKNMKGPDHAASLEPNELKRMIEAIRNVENALGSGKKQASQSEMKNKDVARKSIVAKTKISKGDIYTTDNLDIKRPGSGVSPMKWYDVLGEKAKRDFDKDELIEL